MNTPKYVLHTICTLNKNTSSKCKRWFMMTDNRQHVIVCTSNYDEQLPGTVGATASNKAQCTKETVLLTTLQMNNFSGSKNLILNCGSNAPQQTVTKCTGMATGFQHFSQPS